MAENTKIEWCRHTMNFWVGCTALSPACDHCYAESWAKRTGHPELWQGERRRTTAQNWQQPLKWDAAAAATGERHRVFTNSLADFFDNQVPARWRDDAWHRIDQCRNLDWMVLSKRPENALKMLPSPAIGAPEWGAGWPHVWVGTTVEDRARKRRIDVLRSIPAVVRFLSIEPLLEDLGKLDLTGIHLVLVGGESGPRPMLPAWVRSIRDQCLEAGVAFLFKKWGTWLVGEPTKAPDDDGNPFGLPLRFADGEEFDVNSDGEDILFGAALDEKQGPTAIWRNYHGWQGHLVRRVGKHRAGRLLDGIEHNGMPEVRA